MRAFLWRPFAVINSNADLVLGAALAACGENQGGDEQAAGPTSIKMDIILRENLPL
ncbi:hypothetical protein [Rhizobium sp. RU36D]|uniref:hypothetical protein n=1 Tax=Rhizobium sp. RU36D TaxID=1907415 RepID=UPI0009D8A1A4|nr:hypothetical protein [Rhizobium sp. RU36D]SMD20866.1 hypothetical protein SAMN05880593_1612 [Rhizobium sp. RU36D]